MDSSFMYTGKTSQSTPKLSERLKNRTDKILHRTQEQIDNRIKLAPSAEVIFEMLEDEKRAVMLVRNLDIKTKDERAFMVEMLARQRYVALIDSLKTRLTIILREPDEPAA